MMNDKLFTLNLDLISSFKLTINTVEMTTTHDTRYRVSRIRQVVY